MQTVNINSNFFEINGLFRQNFGANFVQFHGERSQGVFDHQKIPRCDIEKQETDEKTDFIPAVQWMAFKVGFYRKIRGKCD